MSSWQGLEGWLMDGIELGLDNGKTCASILCLRKSTG